MESLRKKYGFLLNTLDTVEADIEFYNKNIDNPDLSDRLKRSLIQCFEYSIELFWKYTKSHMIKIKKFKAPESPRETIYMAKNTEIITADEAAIINEAIKERNKAAHIYSEEMSDIIASNIPKYHLVMKTIAQRLGKELDRIA